MEKALVTSDLGWAKEIMLNGLIGFTVGPKDHHRYPGKVLQLLNDHVLALKMGKAAREQVVAKFSTEVVVERNIGFYKKIVKSEGAKFIFVVKNRFTLDLP